LPARRRIADAEMRGDHPRQSPALQIRDRSRRILELRAIEPGGGEQRFIEVLRNLARLALARPLDARHLEPRVAGERFDRLGERLAAVLHQETDRRAVRAAAEAVIELLGRTDRERRRLFAVERTARLVVGARLLERHVAVDDLDDVDARKKRLDEIAGDQRRALTFAETCAMSARPASCGFNAAMTLPINAGPDAPAACAFAMAASTAASISVSLIRCGR